MGTRVSLQQVTDRIGDGLHGTPKYSETGDIPFINGNNLKSGRIAVDGKTKYVCEDEYEKHAKSLNERTVLLSINGTIGNVAQYRGEKIVLGKSACYLKCNEEVDPRFLVYLLKDRVFQGHIRQTATGTTIKNVSLALVREYEFDLPNMSDQKAIAHILGTLDDKIELNQKMNQTLEEIAKAIFKSWFVDFDPVRAKAEGRPTGLPPEISDLFPDELVDSEIGEIPKGWEIKRVEEICEKIAMGPFGSNIKVSTFVDDGIPIISGHHLHNFLLREGDHKFITEEHAERLKNSLVRSGDVIFTHAGTVGQVSLIPTDSDYETYVISQRQFYARPLRPEHSAYLNFFFHSPVGQHKLLSNVSGSGVPSIARPSSHLKAIELTLADEHLVRKFDQLVGPMIERMVLVSREIETLAELRDTLLPKLISGELRIPDAEKFLKEAGI